jgi:hypothetical protein
MVKTARIAVVLALVPLLVATPARALSVKDFHVLLQVFSYRESPPR